MRRCLLSSSLVLAAFLSTGGNYPEDVYVEMHRTAFAGKPSEAIARFLAHHDRWTQKGAVAALAERKRTVLPLVRALLGDENAWIRAGAVEVLTRMLLDARLENDRGTYVGDWYSELRETTSAALSGELANESAAIVLHSVCVLLSSEEFGEGFKRHFAERSIQSDHPQARNFGRYLYSMRGMREEDLVRAAMASMAELRDSPDRFTYEEEVHIVMMCGNVKSHSAVREAIPLIARHLRNRANSISFHRLRWYYVVASALDVLEAQWDSDVERLPDVVRALCRSAVRLPRGETRAGDLHSRCEKLLARCSAGSAAVIRQCAVEEARWFAGVSDSDIQQLLNAYSARILSVDAARSACRGSILRLEQLADRLDSDKN